MPEQSGIKMRIIALDEIMKCCSEVGRSHENEGMKALLKQLYNAAKIRRDFLSASRSESDEE